MRKKRHSVLSARAALVSVTGTLVFVTGTLVFAGFATGVLARPTGPRIFCAHYPDAPACLGKVVACQLCHTAPPARNSFGEGVLSHLGGIYEDALDDALSAIEGQDSDEDGLTNLEEILLGTWPGDAQSHYFSPTPSAGPDNPRYALGEYDELFAYRRVHLSYCGRSPSFDEVEFFRASVDPSTLLHEALDACLSSTYWLDEGLLRLADKRIRPLSALGVEGPVPLADFEWDYRLWRHVLTGERDMRDLLLADYHVDESGQRVEGPIVEGDFGQPLAPAQRAGMITTQWFLMVHTMFSLVPRTTAAQAYRGYLGMDIARSEGLLPQEGEPVDIDGKGVAQEVCARCHSTLDPLSYAFAYYQGIAGAQTGTFSAARPTWSPNEVQASLLDVPLGDVHEAGVVGWAEVAAASDAFKRTFAQMFFEHALGPVKPNENEELRALWEGMPAEGYSAARLLHRLIDTDSFGAP